jgi:outer membrane protein assembly factor BamD
VLLFGLAFLATAGCGGAQDNMLGYAQSAEKAYEKGMDDFEDEDCAGAEKTFEEVRRKFPFSRFAPLAELRIADCQYIQGSFSSAAVSYQQFLKTHPTHEDAHYAAFKKAMSYYELIPGDYLITPPPWERDQASTRDARMAFDSFIKTYPGSANVPKATQLLEEVENALVRHEMYVAKFYLSRADRRAAAVRLQGIRTQFPSSSLVPEAMLLQAQTYLEMAQPDKARAVLEEIVAYFPAHYQSLRARQYLSAIDKVAGGAI